MIIFKQGDNDHIWFSEDDCLAIIKRFSVGDFLLYKKDDIGVFNWTERKFNEFQDVLDYLNGEKENE